MGKKQLVSFILIATVAGMAIMFYRSPQACPGAIVVINGPAYAGQGSLQQALQQRLTTPHLATGFKTFVEMMPKRYKESPEGVHRVGETTDDYGPVYSVAFGSEAQKVISGMHKTVAALARSGTNVIVDHILYDEKWLFEMLSLFEGIPVYFVGLRMPSSELEAREQEFLEKNQQFKNTIGHARTTHALVHVNAHGIYDLELDTSTLSVDDCVEKIRSLVESPRRPKAFEKLRREMHRKEA